MTEESSLFEEDSIRRKRDRRTQECMYTDKGSLISNGKNLCDCLDENCCGCFFPCVKCKSTKCGPECRQKRKYTYEHYQIEGTDAVVKNRNVNVSE
ncbi:ARL14 effector protein-like [Planococcus citri]|uniref:ARL14 effector protein-like n=1 Tax=Planococcus citri TaxID=170843 RepID=UPI0031F842FC